MSANEMESLPADFTAAERAALDRATVPAMRAGFTADLVAAAAAGGRVPRRRTVRSGWRGHGRVLIGAGALLLASATAAATGWFGKLPIAIPGITRTAAAPEAIRPKHVVHAAKPRPPSGRAEAPAAVADAAPAFPPAPPAGGFGPPHQGRLVRGLPAGRPLVRRALIARFRTMPVERRQAAIAEWRRIKALPQPERKAEIARLKADYLATHPRVAAQVERRLEAKSALAASAGDPPKPGAAPLENGVRPRGPGAGPLTPQERFERRQAMRQWRAQRRAMRIQSGEPPADEGQSGPIR